MVSAFLGCPHIGGKDLMANVGATYTTSMASEGCLVLGPLVAMVDTGTLIAKSLDL